MKRVPWVVSLGVACVLVPGGASAQVGADARRDLDLVELRMRVQALEAQVARLTELLRERVVSQPPAEEDVPRVAADGVLPPAYQMPGYPWLRVEEGVLYLQPVPVSPEFAGLLSHPTGLRRLLAQVDARWEQGGGLRVVNLPTSHLLTRALGVQPADLLVSLNELPFSPAEPQVETMSRALAGQRRFALELVRGEQRVVVAFFVADTAPLPQPLDPIEPDPEQRYRLVVASQDGPRPERNSVVLQRAGGGQTTLFVGDTLDGFLVESIRIDRDAESTRATLVLRSDDGERVLRLTRDP